MAAAPSSWPSGWATLTVIAAAASLTRVSSNCTAPHVWNGAVNGEIASTTSHTAQSLITTPHDIRIDHGRQGVVFIDEVVSPRIGFAMLARERVDITSARFKADPFSFYESLRRDQPVCCVSLPNGTTAWLISRYDDVLAALKDPRLVKNRRSVPGSKKAGIAWTPKMFEPLTRNMLDSDPPDHTRLRALVQKAFTPRVVERMHERIEAVSHQLLDEIAPNQSVDLIERYALPIPTTIIAELIGVPPSDRDRFHRWSNTIVSITLSTWSTVRAIPALRSFLRYIRSQVEARRSEPQGDFLSALVAVEESGERLSSDELVAMVFLLLIAGHETTVNLIGNGVLTLIQNRDQMVRLRRNPSGIATAVEELLRYAGPLDMATERFAREAITLGDITIPQDAVVYAVLASANRDERQFMNPDTLDLNREPNRHVAFGHGIHFCLGAPLARLEGQIAIRTLLERTDDFRLPIPPEGIGWRKGLVLRGLTALPVTLDRRH
jgi:cytochrome P450 PksS